MAKTILLNLTSEMISDFQTCFPKKEDERAHLYQNSTKKINEGIGDVFIKKTVNLRLIKNSKPIVEESTLDKIGFDTVELVLNPEWKPKDIAGTLEPFECVIGSTFWDKICRWAKLSSILNRKFNDSVLENNKKVLSDLKSDGKSDPTQIKQKEEQVSESEKKINKFRDEECLESYIHSLFTEIIVDKIKAAEQEILDKEFEEINNPPKDKEIKKEQ